MEKFNRVLRGYDPEEVNSFIDQIIEQVESMVTEIKEKDEKIEQTQKDYLDLKNKIEYYTKMEDTLNKAIFMAQKTSEQIKLSAHNESEIVLTDAKNNANRIVNEALLKSEKIENEAELLKRNVNIFKKRLRNIIETQLEIVDDIEKVEL